MSDQPKSPSELAELARIWGRQFAPDTWSYRFILELADTLARLASGDFSIGSTVWPGAAKVLEEMGELGQVIGKLIAVAGATKHWSGDLRQMLMDEMSDVTAAIYFFAETNFTLEEVAKMSQRTTEKLERFRQWHKDPKKP